jgi:hypothetical protein
MDDRLLWVQEGWDMTPAGSWNRMGNGDSEEVVDLTELCVNVRTEEGKVVQILLF